MTSRDVSAVDRPTSTKPTIDAPVRNTRLSTTSHVGFEVLDWVFASVIGLASMRRRLFAANADPSKTPATAIYNSTTSNR